MTGAVSSSDPLREALSSFGEQIGQQSEGFAKILPILEAKQDEIAPLAKERSSQGELNRIHALYKKYIEQSAANIRAMSQTAIELKTLLNDREITLEALQTSFMQTAINFNALLEKHKSNENEIKGLEDRIVTLIMTRESFIPIYSN